MNKRGSIVDVLIWIIVSFVTIMFFAVWIYGHGLITDKLTEIETDVDDPFNISQAAADTFGKVDAELDQLHFLAFVIIFTMGISMFISNFLVKAHPVFFIAYIFIVIVAIIFAASISNQYYALMSHETLGSTISAFKGGSFIMEYLPTWAAVFGIFGAVFLFIGIIRDRGVGGGVI